MDMENGRKGRGWRHCIGYHSGAIRQADIDLLMELLDLRKINIKCASLYSSSYREMQIGKTCPFPI